MGDKIFQEGPNISSKNGPGVHSYCYNVYFTDWTMTYGLDHESMTYRLDQDWSHLKLANIPSSTKGVQGHKLQ